MRTTDSASMRLGQRLRSLRQARGWSQEELGRRTGRHWTYIGGLERGERNPTLRVLTDLAEAFSLSLDGLLGETEKPSPRHPLEDILKVSAWDILSAIEKGFRAQIDVKGKLAELFMSRQLDALKQASRIEDFTWQDIDGRPDFIVRYRGHELTLECKNIRNEQYRRPPSYKVELQRTRNSMDGTPARGYKVDDFDVIGVSLFNQTGRWDYAYVATKHLDRRSDMPEFLVVMQRVPIEIHEPWNREPLKAFDDAIGRRR